MSFSLCHVLNIFDIEHKRDLIVSYSLPGGSPILPTH